MAIMDYMMSRLPTTTTGNNAALPYVSDPEETFAGITRDEYLSRLTNYGDFEEGQINKALTDTSLIDQARDSSATSSALTKGIVQRNTERYGASLNPAAEKARNNALTMGNTLNTTGAVNRARINQQDANTTSLARLMAVANASYGESIKGLGTAATNAAKSNQAYKSAKAQNTANNWAMGATVVTAGIMF